MALPVLLGALLWTVPSRAQSQQTETPQGVVAGIVTDSAQHPLPSTRVTIVGTARGAMTGEDGRYLIAAVPAGTQRVRANRIGFASQEQTVTVIAGAQATVNFALTPQVARLEEVVSVGYGEQRRTDVTGSIASVDSSALAKTAIASLEQGLTGRVPGVQVTQGDAAPGGGMRVQIRGINSINSGSAEPLYVIDGVPWTNSGVSKNQMGAVSNQDLNSLTQTNPLAALPPSEIESIDILKDASATAIYGSRGANGVVIITTKHGHRNTEGQTTFNVSSGYADVTKHIDVLNAYDYATYVNQAYINDNNAANMPYGGANRFRSITPDSIRTLVGNGDDWQNEIYHSALVRDGQLSFSGGDDQGSYMVSGNLLDQAGVIRGSGFRRGGLRLNLDRNLKSRFRIQTNVNATRSINDMVRSSTINGYQWPGVVRQALRYTPFVLHDSGSTDPRAEDPNLVALGSNPLRYTDEVSERDQLTRGVGGIRGIVTLPAGFQIDINLGTNYERHSYGIYYPRTVAEGASNGGDAVQSGSEFGNLLDENILRFDRDFGTKQKVNAIAGFSYENDRGTWSSQESQTFPDDILGGNVLQNGTNPQIPRTDVWTAQLASFISRVNYSLLDRYLLTGTFRSDGASKFAKNHKWANFPALAFAWRASQEPFLRDRSWLSDLKLRTSYGRSGNQAIAPYQSLPGISGAGITGIQGGHIVSAYAYQQLGNPDLRWETTDQYDAGVDIGVLGGRLNGTVDYYRKNTFDLLQQVTLAGNTGFNTAWVNSGNVSNRGIELQANIVALNGSRFHGLTWNIGANASHNRNRIESLGTVPQQFAGRLGAGGGMESAPFIQKPGLPIGAMWGYVTDGIIRTAADSAAYAPIYGSAARVGDIKYRDLNGDGHITAADQQVIGDANPSWIWGATSNFTLGNFDASFLLQAVRGNDIIRTDRISYLVLNGSQNVPREFVVNSFDPVKNPNGKYPMIRQSRQLDSRFSDLFIEDGSYVRLKNVQIGYKIPMPTVQSARIYVNAINLLTWTNYTGYDPEVSAFGGVDRPGVDQGSYPQSRVISVGLSTTF